jgi:hypothetical protein
MDSVIFQWGDPGRVTTKALRHHPYPRVIRPITFATLIGNQPSALHDQWCKNIVQRLAQITRQSSEKLTVVTTRTFL